MSKIQSVHHINFLVKDLQASVASYEQALGLGPFEFEDLPERGVRTARVALGDTWLVLVMPTESDSVPGRHLESHGEGFFLMSFGVNDLAAALAARGHEAVGDTRMRAGVGGWKVADLDTEDALGLRFHLTELNAGAK